MLETTLKLEGGDLIYGSSQDVEPILENAKALHREGFHGTSELKHAARIPLVVIEKYCNDRGITFHDFQANKEHIRAVVNDPALKSFRIWPGAI